MPGVPGHFLMIGVPIIRDGAVTLALGARVRSDSLGAILRQQQVPPNGAVALVDSPQRIVARTKLEDVYVGTTVPQAFVDITSRTPKAAGRPTRARAYRSMPRSAARR